MAKATAAKNRRTRPARRGKSRASAKRGAIESNGGKLTTAFAERKSIEDLAAEQGLKPTRVEDILGKGPDLWESDQELEQFVEDIYVRRREDRELAKQ
jgi:hypothetical protein